MEARISHLERAVESMQAALDTLTRDQGNESTRSRSDHTSLETRVAFTEGAIKNAFGYHAHAWNAMCPEGIQLLSDVGTHRFGALEVSTDVQETIC